MRTYHAPFANRTQAGKELAQQLADFDDSVIVMGIPRGGVVVAYEIAKVLKVELDVVVPRKLRAPMQPELAIGAVAAWGKHNPILDQRILDYLNISLEYVEKEIEFQIAEINRRLLAYRGTIDPPNMTGREVIIVDDGVATGSTTKAAILSLQELNASRVMLAVPVGPPDVIDELKSMTDEVICIYTPEPFQAVGMWYRDFDQTTDEEVIQLLEDARSW